MTVPALHYDNSSEGRANLRRAVFWGYGHYLIFAAAAAVGSGLAVAVDEAAGHAHVGPVAAGLAVAIPVGVYLLSLWVLHDRPEYRGTRLFGPVAAVIVLLAPWSGHAVLLIGITLAAMAGIKIVVMRQ